MTRFGRQYFTLASDRARGPEYTGGNAVGSGMRLLLGFLLSRLFLWILLLSYCRRADCFLGPFHCREDVRLSCNFQCCRCICCSLLYKIVDMIIP